MGLARQAIKLPLVALSVGLEAWERSRGLREFAVRRGNEALGIVAHTPIGRLLPHEMFDDDADAEAARITGLIREHSAEAEPYPSPQPRTEARGTRAESPETQPEPQQQPQHEPGPIAVKAAQVSEQLAVPVPQDRSDLPIQDFDNISLGSLRARLRSLSVEELVTLREWEQAHAQRLPVLTTLANRIAKLADSPQGADDQV